MHETFTIRRAVAADAHAIASHRVAMFRDLGRVAHDTATSLQQASREWLEGALARGECVGWLAVPDSAPDTVVAGAGGLHAADDGRAWYESLGFRQADAKRDGRVLGDGGAP